MPRASQWISDRFENLIEQARKEPALLEFDLVIIGSGYGGAFAAYTFAGCEQDGRPLNIAVLERGDEYLSGMFPKDIAELPAHVRGLAGATSFGQRHGLFDLRVNEHINVLTGSGVGGGSLINAGVMEAPLAQVFDERWPKKLAGGATLDFERARYLVGASNEKNEPNTVNALNPLPPKFNSLKALAPAHFKEAAITMAFSSGPNQAGVSLNSCNQCGDCVTGCNQGAKNSLDVNLLVQAKRKGVKIYAGASVSKLEKDACSGWTLHTHMTHDKAREAQADALCIKAKRVILAAGSLGSSEILLRSASKSLKFSKLLGQKFSGNGDAIAVGFKQNQLAQAIAWPEQKPSDRNVGPTITGIIDQRESSGLLIEEMAVPNALARIFSDIYTTTNCLHDLTQPNNHDHRSGPVVDDPFSLNHHNLNHTSLYAIMGDDDADGQLELKSPKSALFAEGQLQVHWPKVQDKPLFDQQITTLSALTQATLKGRLLTNPAWSPLPSDMSKLYNATKGPLLTVHPLGGCSMADSVHHGVVNDCGQVFNADSVGGLHEGLIVLDGSIMPSALGINPALTISAIALRNCEILRDSWGMSQKNHTIPTVCLTEAQTFQHRPLWRNTDTLDTPQPTMIEVNERLIGELELETSKGKEPFVAELTLAFSAHNIEDFFSTAGNGSLQNRTSMVKENSGSRLRIYRPEHWQALTFSRATDAEFETAALLSAPISGQLEIMQRQTLPATTRFRRGVKAWFLNRGLRDILQGLQAPKKARNLSAKDTLKNLFLLAGHAGEVRLFDYQLQVNKPDSGWPRLFQGFSTDLTRYPLAGKKRITYKRKANPVRQFSEISLSQFPGLIRRKGKDILAFDNRYQIRQATPFIRITQHSNLVQAFADLCSFYAYFVRLMIGTHLFTFRMPDRREAKQPQRFAGEIPRLPAPVIEEIQVDSLANGLPIHIRLTRYHNEKSSQRPLVLLHGYSASSTTWAHPAIKTNAAKFFHDTGRDVWLVDLRTSCGFLTAMLPWQFEDVAFQDIPLAFNHILHATGHEKCDVIAHCMGSAMLSMALLKAPEPGDRFFKEREELPRRIENLVLTQVGPKVSFSPMNMTRGYLLKNLKHLLGNLPFTFRPSDAPSILESLFDRALQILPYPESDFNRENPPWSGKYVRWSATRRRIDALYGQAFSLDNMSDALLACIDDIFGPLSMGTLTQTIHFALQEQITNFDGENIYATQENFRQRWACNTLSLHGAKSGLADLGTATLLGQAMSQAQCNYQQIIFPDFGHQDLLIGKGNKSVFKKIQAFFVASQALRQEHQPTLSSTNNRYRFELPSLGPVIGPTMANVQPLMLGTALAADTPDWALFVETDKDGTPLVNLAQALTNPEMQQHFYLKSAQDMQHQWLKLTLSLDVVGSTPRYWQCFFIYDDLVCTEELPLNAPHPDNLLELLRVSTSPAQKITATFIQHMLHNQQFLNTYEQAFKQPFSSRKLGQVICPARNDSAFSFVVAACQFPALLADHDLAFASYARLAQRLHQPQPPQLLVLIGDQVYVDPTAGVMDAQAYHHRYVEPYQTWLGQKEVREVLRQLPAYMMPDDHEIANDWDLGVGQTFNYSRIKPGSKNYLWFQRHCTQQPRPWYFSPRLSDYQQLPLWQTFERAGVSFFLADTRTERQGRDIKHNNSHIMSAEQFKALTHWLKTEPADTPKVISTASMLLPRRLRTGTGSGAHRLSDAWDGYPKHLNALLAFIAAENIQNLVFVSGDEHISCHVKITIHHPDRQQIIHSIHSSGLYAPLPFVNTKAEEFAERELLNIDVDGQVLKCEVQAHFIPGDGFAELQFKKQSDGWQLACTFNRKEGEQRLQLDFYGAKAKLHYS